MSAQARLTADAFKEPMAFPWISEVEVLTTLYRTQKAAALAAILRALNSARSEGLLVHCPIDQEATLRRALDLIQQHAAQFQCRALDLLHVALALEIKAPLFVSFDQRQRRLATRAGLNLLPK